MRGLLRVSFTAALLSGVASAQFWSAPQAFGLHPAMKGFQVTAKGLVRESMTLTLDSVAGRVVGVLIDAPLADTDGVARALVAAWDGDLNGVTPLKLSLDKPDFQQDARDGFVETTSEEGTDLIAVRLRGQGAQARWLVYAAINVLPESTFPGTRNVTGNAKAPVNIHILSDFQCPACLQLWQTAVPGWRREPQTYRVAYHHFPLSYHKNAFQAAEASECAAAQGQFWGMADQLFGRYDTWIKTVAPANTQKFQSFATNLKLNGPAFKKCLTTRASQAEVNRQMKAGQAAFLTGTPTVYANGIKVNDYSDPDELKAIRAVTTASPSARDVIQARLKQF